MENIRKPPSTQENAEAAAKARDKEINEAVERVYRKYGKDIAAFNRDVQKDLEVVKRG